MYNTHHVLLSHCCALPIRSVPVLIYNGVERIVYSRVTGRRPCLPNIDMRLAMA